MTTLEESVRAMVIILGHIFFPPQLPSLSATAVARWCGERSAVLYLALSIHSIIALGTSGISNQCRGKSLG